LIKLNTDMESNTHLTTWISRVSRERFAHLAKVQGLSESALLRRLVESALLGSGVVESTDLSPAERAPASGRMSIRLLDDDLLLLRERAKARRIPSSTYVSYLVRAHLRSVPPLLTQELEALRRSVAEVAAIGRNINQIAKVVNQHQWPEGPDPYVLKHMIMALTAMRSHIRDLIRANLASWESGSDKTAG
jgi:hypothetical protein